MLFGLIYCALAHVGNNSENDVLSLKARFMPLK
jgi:hypothetical protein